jgi:hypothetical protein
VVLCRAVFARLAAAAVSPFFSLATALDASVHAARSEETDCCCAELFARVPSCFVTLSLHVVSTVAAPTTSPFSTCSSAPVNRCCAFLKSTLKLTEPPAVVTAGLVLTSPPAVAVAPALFEPALVLPPQPQATSTRTTRRGVPMRIMLSLLP